MEILKDDILQLNFHIFIESWAQFEELHGPFVNLGVHLPPKHNSPFFKFEMYIEYFFFFLPKILLFRICFEVVLSFRINLRCFKIFFVKYIEK